MIRINCLYDFFKFFALILFTKKNSIVIGYVRKNSHLNDACNVYARNRITKI